MRFFTLTALILLFSFQAWSQGCDGVRYLQDIATSVTVESAIKFGENNLATGTPQELFMDVYTPDGDTETNRPAIIYAFGGSFIGGTRTDGFVTDFCERYAKLGYVTVAIDYRLYELALGIPDSTKMINEVVMAVADTKAAVRFLRKSAIDGGNPYGIDPNKIYAGGISAGAIAAAHAAYITPNSANLPSYVQEAIDNNGGIDGDTDLPGDSHMGTSSEIQAVINMSGALHRANMLEAGGPPIVSTHGNADETVPYGFGFATVAVFEVATLQGSSMLHDQAVAVGIPSELYTVDNGGHVDWYNSEPHFTNSENIIKTFLHNRVTCTTLSNNDLEDVSAAVTVFPNPVEGHLNIYLDNLVEKYSLTITDAAGRQIEFHPAINDMNFSLDVSQFAQGMYNLHLEFEDTEFAPVNKRIIVR